MPHASILGCSVVFTVYSTKQRLKDTLTSRKTTSDELQLTGYAEIVRRRRTGSRRFRPDGTGSTTHVSQSRAALQLLLFIGDRQQRGADALH